MYLHVRKGAALTTSTHPRVVGYRGDHLHAPVTGVGEVFAATLASHGVKPTYTPAV